MSFVAQKRAFDNVSGLTFSESAVLNVLAFCANERCEAWPAVELIAARTRLSERTVQRALKALVGRGLIVPGRHRDERIRSVRYTLALPADAADQPRRERGIAQREGDTDDARGRHSRRARVTLTTSEGDTVSPYPSMNRKVNESESSDGRKSLPPKDWQPSAADREHAARMGLVPGQEWSAFVAYHAAQGTRPRSVSALWRSWCNRAAELAAAGPGRAAASPTVPVGPAALGQHDPNQSNPVNPKTGRHMSNVELTKWAQEMGL